MIQGLVGNFSVSDTVGLGPIETVTLMTDGSLEPLDVLRIVGHGISPFLHCQHDTPKRAQVLFASTMTRFLFLSASCVRAAQQGDEAAPIMPDIGLPLVPAPDRTLNLP